MLAMMIIISGSIVIIIIMSSSGIMLLVLPFARESALLEERRTDASCAEFSLARAG